MNGWGRTFYEERTVCVLKGPVVGGAWPIQKLERPGWWVAAARMLVPLPNRRPLCITLLNAGERNIPLW